MLRNVRFWKPNGGSIPLILLCSERGSKPKIDSCWIVSGLLWNAVMYFMVFSCFTDWALSEASGLFLALISVQTFLGSSCKSRLPRKSLFGLMLLCSVVSFKWAVIHTEESNCMEKLKSQVYTKQCYVALWYFFLRNKRNLVKKAQNFSNKQFKIWHNKSDFSRTF